MIEPQRNEDQDVDAQTRIGPLVHYLCGPKPNDRLAAARTLLDLSKKFRVESATPRRADEVIDFWAFLGRVRFPDIMNACAQAESRLLHAMCIQEIPALSQALSDPQPIVVLVA